jgi:hypothetical protein
MIHLISEQAIESLLYIGLIALGVGLVVTIFSYLLGRIKRHYVFILPIILLVTGGGLMILAFIVGGWDAIAFILFGLIGLFSSATSLLGSLIVYFSLLKKNISLRK